MRGLRGSAHPRNQISNINTEILVNHPKISIYEDRTEMVLE